MLTLSEHRARVSRPVLSGGQMSGTRHAALLVALALICLSATGLAQQHSGNQEPEGEPETGLRPGMVLDQTTASLASAYLPPEILKHYQRNEFRHEIVEWPLGKGTQGAVFVAQTERNAQTFTVSELGTIIDKATGKQPPYVYGTPFPKIDPSDPSAAVKALWNYFYTASWWNGNSHTSVRLLWLSMAGIDREAGQEVFYKFYDGLPPDFRPRENSHNLLAQFVSMATHPADLAGTVALSWRYRQADRRDLVWAYVPALRRVRAVSPANRSDGFLGSDMSQDDGQFFDGKPEDFTWTLVGERESLVFVDPFRLSGDVEVHAVPGGGWRSTMKAVPYFGFQDPNWRGVAWAPLAHKLALRNVWVVEGVPKDRYYLYGKLQLLIDQETWQGAFNRKFGWNGELLGTLVAAGGPAIGAPDGIHFFSSGVGNGEVAQFVENIKLSRATGITIIDNVNDRLVPLEAPLFDYQTLHRLGK